jgi:hypothetical protein
MIEQVQLFRKNSMGIGTWRIWRDGAVLRYAHAVTEGASEVAHEDLIQLNGSGRNLDQQMELEMNSRINRMLDKGYKYLRTEALAGATNQMGFRMPMLAQTLEKSGPVDFSCAYVQPKLDGHRCLITNFEGELIAYTRKGKPITTVNHVLQELTWLPEGRTLDGELYIHGRKLQSISSLIKREQADSKLLKYHWYDYMSDVPFHERLASIHKACSNIPMVNVHKVETTQVDGMYAVFGLFHKYRLLGYEGAMVRHGMAGYQDGARAVQLLKVKERHDCEVVVLAAAAARDGSAILTVQYKFDGDVRPHMPAPDVVFDITAPGSIPEKQRILREISSYIGRKLQIEYAMITDDGKPFHAVAMRWFEEL